MKWRRREDITNESVLATAQQLEIDPLLARILMNRGMTNEEIRVALIDTHEAILPPEELTNALEAAKVIASYLRDPQARVYIFGDYDADGVSSLTVMGNGCREVAASPDCVNTYVPERSEGYGMSMTYCKALVKDVKAAGHKRVLVITVDNGIACVDEVAYLKKNGIETIVTDHHMAKKEVPDCLIVDPHNHGEPDTFKHLCGAGVAFKVIQLVQAEFGVYNAANYLFAVAIGTVADMMPMVGENIALVNYGLEQMNSDYCPRNIQMMKDYLGKTTLVSGDLGWEIGPRLNACGRMGSAATAAVFMSRYDLPEEELEEWLHKVERLNAERKAFTDKAKKLVDKTDYKDQAVCFMDATEYPEGIVGIIANKLIEKHKKPVVVLAGHDKMVGSARSLPGINLPDILLPEYEAGNIERWGGHGGAAGLTVSRDRYEELKANVNARVEAMMSAMNMDVEPVEEDLVIDEIISLTHLNKDTFELINSIPYDNRVLPKPVFALCNLDVIGTSVSKNNPSNICFKVKDETGAFDIWAWGMAQAYEELGSPSKIHLAGCIEQNFMNKRFYTMKVVDLLGA